MTSHDSLVLARIGNATLKISVDGHYATYPAQEWSDGQVQYLLGDVAKTSDEWVALEEDKIDRVVWTTS